DRVGAITTTGAVAEVPVIAGPADLVTGPDGNVWFTDIGSARIGRIATNGATSFFTLSTIPSSRTSTIAVGPDGHLWVKGFVLSGIPNLFLPYVDIVWRVDVTGQVLGTFQPGPTTQRGVSAGSITAGPDGRMWFAQPHLDRVVSTSVLLPYA